MSAMPNTTRLAARIYTQAGLSVIPIRTDGSKALALDAGIRVTYEKRLATTAELDEWFVKRNPTPGIAILGGKVSGQLQCLDFDTDAEKIFPKFINLLAQENVKLYPKLTIHKTPRPGYHIVYRVDNPNSIGGSTKLALSRPRIDKQTGKEVRDNLIETRSEGGYFIAPGSPGNVHETGRTWQHQSGPKLSKVQTITVEEWGLLCNLARSFNCATTANPVRHGDRVGDQYNASNPDIPAILVKHGWTTRDGINLKRPGKTEIGISATWGVCRGKNDDIPLFNVFSTNAHPFEAKCHDAFTVFALLEHGGDFRAAVKALVAMGFGDQPKKQIPKRTRVATAVEVINSLSDEELKEVVALLDRK